MRIQLSALSGWGFNNHYWTYTFFVSALNSVYSVRRHDACSTFLLFNHFRTAVILWFYILDMRGFNAFLKHLKHQYSYWNKDSLFEENLLSYVNQSSEDRESSSKTKRFVEIFQGNILESFVSWSKPNLNHQEYGDPLLSC